MTALIRILFASFVALCVALPAYAEETETQVDQQQMAANDVQSEQLASEATDQQVLAANEASTEDKSKAEAPAAAAPVNINSADVKILKKELGLDVKKAKAIVAFRKKNGDFKSIDDLTKVKGISKKWLEKNHDKMTV